jgi:hypothetical protein
VLKLNIGKTTLCVKLSSKASPKSTRGARHGKVQQDVFQNLIVQRRLKMTEVEKIETVIWFDDDSREVIGRELEDDESRELTEEDVIKTIDDESFSIVVRGNPGYRHYVNLLAPDDYLDEGFTIPTDMPGFDRLLCAIDNAHYEIARTMDGEFTLVETESGFNGRSIKAEVELLTDGKTKIVKALDGEDYDIVLSESGYKVVENVEAE